MPKKSVTGSDQALFKRLLMKEIAFEALPSGPEGYTDTQAAFGVGLPGERAEFISSCSSVSHRHFFCGNGS
jgi:hypothetical protein